MKRVLLSQVNNIYGRSAFLPYSVGLLQAYAQKDPVVRAEYEFLQPLFKRDPIEEVVQRVGKIDVAGISCYIWNWTYSINLAKAIKEANPSCLVILGGPHVPYESQGFFQQHPYVDLLVHNEGELTFHEILTNSNYKEIKGISYPLEDGSTRKNLDRARIDDLDTIPSPYVTGTFDSLMRLDYDWHSIFEGTRGCPFLCAFCDWGSATFSKVKKHSDAYLQEEIDWCAKHKIDLLYGADANTGILERDVALAEYMVKTKQQYGYPNKFRAAYAKNSVDRVFEINRVLNKAGMSKGATLSFQSMDEHTLDVIKRKNIGTEKYKQLMSKYAKENIPTYSEIIIGLAGETYESFADGLDSLLRSGCHRGLSIYTCELLPNSEMSKVEYREKYGIQSVMSRVPFYHAVPSKDPYQEFYEIVTATKDLSKKDWLECQMLSWIIQGLHSLGLTHFLAAITYYRDGISYRQFYESLLKHAKNNPDTALGKLYRQIESYFIHINSGWEFPDLIDEYWGNICWPPEEWLYLNCMLVIDDFFHQLPGWLPRDDAFFFQFDYCSSLYEGTTISRTCNTNVVDFVNKVMVGDLIEWEDTSSTQYTVRCNKKWEDAQQFAREVVWYGRKGNADFVEVSR